MLALRPYQEESIGSIKKAYKEGHRRILVVLPTGSGKTVIFSNLAITAKGPVLILANRTELLEQARDKLLMINPELKNEVGLLNSDHKDFDKRILIASIQAAYQAETLLKLSKTHWSLVIVDEAHRAVSNSYKVVLGALGFNKGRTPRGVLVGFTATPYRTDGASLGNVFDTVAYEKSLQEMIAEGWLCPVRGIKIATNLDLSSVEVQSDDFQALSLAKVMNSPALNNLAFDVWNKHSYDTHNKRLKQTLAFAVDIPHATALAQLFKEKNIRAEVIHSNLSTQTRKQILEAFRNKEINVLCNVLICTEGLDLPDIEIILNLRPTRSKQLFTQILGRGLRLAPLKKECLLLDFSDKAHSLCTLNTLFPEDKEASKKDRKASNALRTLPIGIDQKLRAALLESNPLSDDFVWINENGTWVMKGINLLRLCISPINRAKDKWSVSLTDKEGHRKPIGEDLSFSYAFGAAETFAKNSENRKLFLLSDLSAPWRKDPASKDQKKFLQEHGFFKGLNKLTKGDASDAIASILNKNIFKKSRSNNISKAI